MRYRITRVSIGQLVQMLTVLYALIGLVFVPFFLIAGVSDPEMGFFGVGFAFLMPILYAVMGALGGLIGGGLYNLVAKGIGGVEISLDATQPDPDSGQGAELQ